MDMQLICSHSRNAVFRRWSFADNIIAQIQQSFAAELDTNSRVEAAMLKKYYDHQTPSFHAPMAIDGHCVIAYKAESRQAYFRELPLPAFFSKLQTEKLYCMDFLATGMADFPFENFIKRNKLKRMPGNVLKAAAFSLNPVDAVNVLELFYFSGRYERSAVILIAEGAVPVAMRLCKDGNFHLNYKAEQEDQIKDAATAVGFMVGDIDLCWAYSVPV